MSAVVSVEGGCDEIGYVYLYWIEEMQERPGWYRVHAGVGHENLITHEVHPVEGSVGVISQPCPSWEQLQVWMVRFAEGKVRDVAAGYCKQGQRVEIRRR